MRVRTAVSVALLLVPGLAGAQRLPTPHTGAEPGRPVPMGKQPEPIARSQALQRSRVSAESYPMASYFRTPSLAGTGQRASWRSAGAGGRIEYRVNDRFSATLDLTSSIDGEPMRVETAELGGRLRAAPSESRFTPYLDARVGVTLAQVSSGQFGSVGGATPVTFYDGAGSYGFGALAGAGVEYALTSAWALTTGASVTQSWLAPLDLAASRGTSSFGLTSLRATLGIKYNPVRSMVMRQER